MIETVHLSFYRVSQCGYYKHRQKSPEFGTLSSTLNELRLWLGNGRLFGSTATYQTDDDSDVKAVYCLGLESIDDDNFLLTLWNAVDKKGGGNLASVDPSAPVGDATVETIKVPVDRIPGYPTRFWIIPSLLTVASVKLPESKSHQAGLNRYILGYLQSHSTHKVVEDAEDDGDVRIAGYRNKEGDEPLNVEPRFSMRIIANPTHLEEIRANYRSITQLARKQELPYVIANQPGPLQWMLNSVGLSKPGTIDGSIKARYQIRFEPTKHQVDDIIKKWEDDHGHSKFDDVGFIFKRRSSPVWLSQSYERESVNLDIAYKKDDQLDSTALLKALVGCRPKFYKRLVIKT